MGPKVYRMGPGVFGKNIRVAAGWLQDAEGTRENGMGPTDFSGKRQRASGSELKRGRASEAAVFEPDWPRSAGGNPRWREGTLKDKAPTTKSPTYPKPTVFRRASLDVEANASPSPTPAPRGIAGSVRCVACTRGHFRGAFGPGMRRHVTVYQWDARPLPVACSGGTGRSPAQPCLAGVNLRGTQP